VILILFFSVSIPKSSTISPRDEFRKELEMAPTPAKDRTTARYWSCKFW
jgi:hypothetical protein